MAEQEVFTNGLGRLVTPDSRQALVISKIKELAQKILQHEICVDLVFNPDETSAAYGEGYLILNLATLPSSFFNTKDSRGATFFWYICHEFAHEVTGDHESRDFSDANCDVGAAIAMMIRTEPEFFKFIDEPVDK